MKNRRFEHARRLQYRAAMRFLRQSQRRTRWSLRHKHVNYGTHPWRGIYRRELRYWLDDQADRIRYLHICLSEEWRDEEDRIQILLSFGEECRRNPQPVKTDYPPIGIQTKLFAGYNIPPALENYLETHDGEWTYDYNYVYRRFSDRREERQWLQARRAMGKNRRPF